MTRKASLLLIMLLFCACGSSNAKYIGTWKSDNGLVLRVNEDGSWGGSHPELQKLMNASWKISSANKIVFSSQGTGGGSGELIGGKLTVYWMFNGPGTKEGPHSCTYVRQ